MVIAARAAIPPARGMSREETMSNGSKISATANSLGVGVDPITLEVIRHGMISICDQIDAT